MTTLKELRERAREAGIKGFSKMNTAQINEALAAQAAPAPIEIPGPNGTVTVSRSEDRVTVTWLCGARRYFSVEELRLTLERFEQIAAYDAWYEDSDGAGRPWAAVLTDGQFHGDERVNGRSGSVPWDEFRSALQQSLT